MPTPTPFSSLAATPVSSPASCPQLGFCTLLPAVVDERRKEDIEALSGFGELSPGETGESCARETNETREAGLMRLSLMGYAWTDQLRELVEGSKGREEVIVRW